jgi:hypothetical protein
MEEFCSDLLTAHHWKCVCALAGMAAWRFSSRRKVMEPLLIGTGYKPLQSVNYHDSYAHSYERSGVLVGLVVLGWFGLVMFGW